MEDLCRAGSYCRPQTGEPTPCPAGYHCPEGSHTYNTPQQMYVNLICFKKMEKLLSSHFVLISFDRCPYPYYCPANTSTMLSCGGGFMPRNASGLRVSQESSCLRCEAGTYRPSGSPHLRCLACPPGYHCPPGKSSNWETSSLQV